MFDNNLANVDRISKFFHEMIRTKNLYVYSIPQRFPPHRPYVATLPCESRESKNVTEFSRLTVTINMFK